MTRPVSSADPWQAFHFAWRGWILAGLLLALVIARRHSSAPLSFFWLALLAAGMAWRAWAGWHISGHSNGAAWSGPALASTGPYRLSRHPLYFANLLCAAGLILFAHCLPLWAALFGLVLAAAHHESLARSEEAYLLAKLGESYRRYMQVTPRWPGFPLSPAAIGDREGAIGDREERQAFPAKPEPTGTWRMALARQGWNLAKGGAGAAVLWFAAAFR